MSYLLIIYFYFFLFSFNKSIGQSKGRQNIKVSVVQHFKKTYNYDIKYPNLPCLDVSDYNNRKWAIPIEVNICGYIFIIVYVL